MTHLLKVESIRYKSPAANELLEDMEDLYPTAVRVVMESFARNNFSMKCISGRKCLAAMVLKPPDQKANED